MQARSCLLSRLSRRLCAIASAADLCRRVVVCCRDTAVGCVDMRCRRASLGLHLFVTVRGAATLGRRAAAGCFDYSRELC